MRLGEPPFVRLGVHLGHECHLVASIHPRKQMGIVVARVHKEPLEQLALGQDLACSDGNVGLVGRQLRTPLSDIVSADGDARTSLDERDGMRVENHHGSHHLCDAADGHRRLLRGRRRRGHPGDRHRRLPDGRPDGLVRTTRHVAQSSE